MLKKMPLFLLRITTFVLLLSLGFNIANVSAISRSRLESLINNRPYYDSNSASTECSPTIPVSPTDPDPNDPNPSPDGSVNGPNYPGTTFKYGSGPRLSTGLPSGANISVEDFAKLILKFIAFGAGKPESEVITDQKVMAVVAWVIVEGGSIKNVAAYNGLNNAKDPILNDLEPIYNNVYADGNQHPAFKFIEQGVESNVRFIEKAHYSRLREMLLDPTMTAQKFVENFDNKSYNGATGQLTWAAGGYLLLFRDVVRSMETNPAAKARNYSRPILGPDALKALRELGISASEQTTPLNIATTTTEFSGSNGSCVTTPTSTTLPSGSAQDLAKQILDNPNIDSSAARSQLENIASGQGPCPTVNGGKYTIKEDLLRIIVALGKNNRFKIASLHRGCTGSTVGSGSKSRHWAGAAVDISGASGINGVTMPGFESYDPVILRFIKEVIGLFPAGDFGIGLPNSRYINEVKSLMKTGNAIFLDTPRTTGATGPHVHIQVPR